MQVIRTDIAIFGGGIAGLWALHRLRQQGYRAVLFETDSIGSGQTIKSQGIIHGGLKYALQGSLTESSQQIADMPTLWSQCLKGQGEIDLSTVPITSSYQYLFSPSKLAGTLTGFFAQLALKGRMHALPKAEYPAVFQDRAFHGVIYALEEIAIDVPALLKALMTPMRDRIFKIEAIAPQDVRMNAEQQIVSLTIRNENHLQLDVEAEQYLFVGGAGNELFAALNPKHQVATQRRPLHMVYVKMPMHYPMFAHCLGASSTPRITITTHQTQDGGSVWYLGGQIAESGVARDQQAQMAFARQELTELFPWVDFTQARFGSFYVDRAEPQQAGGKRPDGPYAERLQNYILAWPTKLALAPSLANHLLKDLEAQHFAGRAEELAALRDFSLPAIATPPWEYS